MKKYSILSLNTFFFISSLNASAPQSQANLGSSYLAGKVLAPLVPPRANQPLLGRSVWQTSQAMASASASLAASTPGATNIAPSLNSSAMPASAPMAQASSSSTTPVEKQLPPIELTNRELSGYVLSAAILNKWNGTDQTLLDYLRKRDHQQPLITNTTEAQQILSSVVSNFKKRIDYQEKMNDILELMTFIKQDNIIVDRISRQTLRKFLKEYEDKQEKDLLEVHTQQVTELKAAYELQTKSMQKTEIARHLTYQGDSDNEEEIRVYKPTDKLMAFETTDLVTKIKPAKK